MTHPGCRIKTVRDKRSGFVLHRIRPEQDAARINLMREVRESVEGHIESGCDIAGMAFIVWGADARSTAIVRSGGRSNIPDIMVPDFVRNRLLADKVMEWVQED